MKRRNFIVSSALGAVGLTAGGLPLDRLNATTPAPQAGTRKILIAGGGFNKAFIKYMAELTGKPKPKILYLPTASADRPGSFMENCKDLNVEPSIQNSFISSNRQTTSWEDVLLSVDGIVASGGNTLNQQVIWRAHGIDVLLRRAWDRGIVLGGASAGSLCWFDAGTTDSRPKELSIVQCLGFIKGSHSPHYDREPKRRPLYLKLIASGQLDAGYACHNDAGIYFEDNAVKRVVKTRDAAKVFHVTRVNDEAVERELPAEMIS